jgi:hypothetical protein
MRKLLCFLFAGVLAAFALSANAAGGNPNKSISLSNVSGQPNVIGATLAPGTYNIFLQLNNDGQSGNASSAELDFTSTPQLTVNNGTISGGKGPVAGALMNGQTGAGFKGIQFTFTLPNKSSAIITLNVTVTAGATCGGTQIVWQPYAWTGGTGTPSTSFSFPPTGTYTSNLQGAPACTLSFANGLGNATQPADAFVGSGITTAAFNSAGAPVQVLATQNGNPVSGVSVTIGDIGACTVSGSATTGASGTASLSIASSTAGTNCQLTATANGFNGATSNAFNVVVAQGTLGCSPAPTSTFGGLGQYLVSNTFPPVGAPDWGLLRGFNRDGTQGNSCTLVPFTFTLNGNNSALFTEDSLGQPTSVEYLIRWTPVDVDDDGWSAKQPCTAWGMTNPDPGNDPTVCGGDYVPALACLADDVNAPGDGTGEVMPFIPDVAPYQGNSHSQYRPFLADNVTKQRAKVCVSQQGWTATNGQVQYWTKLIDQADAGIRLP